MDRRRAGNPGRRGFGADTPLPRGRVVSDSDTRAADYTRAPRAGVQSLEGPRAAGSRAANIQTDDEPRQPDLSNATAFPERPGRYAIRRLKKGGAVKAKTKLKASGRKAR